MEFQGKVRKSKTSKYWVVYVELLDLSTQGISKKNALEMIQDAIELLVDKPGFRVKVREGKNGSFTVGANQPTPWMAFMFQCLRMKEGLTIEEVAKRMGFSSKTAYARYEQGKSAPSLEKFISIVEAIAPDKRAIFHLAA